jgi:hypothetical protein
MSWSITVIGKPENVVAALEAQSAKESGQCKIEFDDALPHLVGLVRQSFNEKPEFTPMVRLEASGSGCASSDSNAPGVMRQTSRSCQVKIEQFYAKLV